MENKEDGTGDLSSVSRADGQASNLGVPGVPSHPLDTPPPGLPAILLPIEVWTEILKHAYPRQPDYYVAYWEEKAPLWTKPCRRKQKFCAKGRGKFTSARAVKLYIRKSGTKIPITSMVIKEGYTRTVYRKKYEQ